VAPGYVAIGTQLLSRPGPPDPVTAGPAAVHSLSAEAPAGSWDERVPPPGCDATLLAVVPVPGTTTSLAIVAYAISSSDTQQGVPETDGGSGEPRPWRRPATAEPGPAAQTGSGLIVDHLQRRVWADGAEIELTFQEYELLAFLSAYPATVFSRAELLERVWSRGPACDDPAPGRRNVSPDSRTVDVHVSRLRRRLGPVYGQYLVTEYRAGYQFRPLDA
jgi:DNA-binding winged helix-turn-helix (wHTH) protein